MTHVAAAFLLLLGLLSALLTGLTLHSFKELRINLLTLLSLGSTGAAYALLVWV